MVPRNTADTEARVGDLATMFEVEPEDVGDSEAPPGKTRLSQRLNGWEWGSFWILFIFDFDPAYIYTYIYIIYIYILW
jgi:hypothetical protein